MRLDPTQLTQPLLATTQTRVAKPAKNLVPARRGPDSILRLVETMKPTVLLASILLIAMSLGGTCEAQITPSQILSAQPSKRATIEDYLINRLRATTEDQKDYVREVLRLVDQRRLELKLVLALQRRARARRPHFPLPLFEQTIRFEGRKRGVVVPTLQEIVARNGASATRAARDSRLRF